jgi:hypothetical protein
LDLYPLLSFQNRLKILLLISTENGELTTISQTLKITFADGSVYEYFDVPKATYVKMLNADSLSRFAKRHIYQSFNYRNISKLTQA